MSSISCRLEEPNAVNCRSGGYRPGDLDASMKGERFVVVVMGDGHYALYNKHYHKFVKMTNDRATHLASPASKPGGRYGLTECVQS